MSKSRSHSIRSHPRIFVTFNLKILSTISDAWKKKRGPRKTNGDVFAEQEENGNRHFWQRAKQLRKESPTCNRTITKFSDLWQIVFLYKLPLTGNLVMKISFNCLKLYLLVRFTHLFCHKCRNNVQISICVSVYVY